MAPLVPLVRLVVAWPLITPTSSVHRRIRLLSGEGDSVAATEEARSPPATAATTAAVTCFGDVGDGGGNGDSGGGGNGDGDGSDSGKDDGGDSGGEGIAVMVAGFLGVANKSELQN